MPIRRLAPRAHTTLLSPLALLLFLGLAAGLSQEQSAFSAPALDAIPSSGASTANAAFPSSLDDGHCDTAPAPQTRVLTEVRVNGATRRYRLSIPPVEAGTRMPVLLAFQGGDGGDSPFPQQGRFNALAEQEGIILASPIAELLPPNEGAWQLNTRPGFTQDIEYVEAILDDLSANYCVEESMVYATGYSLGSMFTYELPCQISDRFAAIASYAGTMPVAPAACATDESIGIMHLHSRDDWIISYDNEWDWKEWDSVGTMRDIPGLVEFWGEEYGCQERSEEQAGSTTHIVHDDCEGNARVEHYALDGIGHSWPDRVDGVSTERLIWDFVSGFSKPSGPSEPEGSLIYLPRLE